MQRILTTTTILLIAALLCLIVHNEIVIHSNPDEVGLDRTALLRAVGRHNTATIVLALQKGCHYCQESAPFYQELINTTKAPTSSILALLPTGQTGLRSYLESLGLYLGPESIVQDDLHAIGITATPTIILLNASNKIKNVWRGELTAIQENEVLAAVEREGLLDSAGVQAIERERTRQRSDVTFAAGVRQRSLSQISEDSSDSPLHISSDDFAKKYSEMPDEPIIDARKRIEYAKAHIRHSLNIPSDEMIARAPHELPASLPVYVYCQYRAGEDDPDSDRTSPSQCEWLVAELHRIGYRKAQAIDNSPLELLKAKGIIITTDVAK